MKFIVLLVLALVIVAAVFGAATAKGFHDMFAMWSIAGVAGFGFGWALAELGRSVE